MFSYPIKPIAQSTLMDSRAFNVNLNTHRLPTTQAMVEEAIFTLNTTRGISLQRLKKYIVEKYYIEITGRRYNLIKDYLRAQMAHGTIANVSGKGLSGSFRLQNKKNKASASITKERTIVDKQRKGGVERAEESTVAHKRKKTVNKIKSDKLKEGTSKSVNQTAAPVALSSGTPTNTVTLCMEPQAPHRNSSAVNLNNVEQEGGTPRSAGRRIGRKRKLMPPPEPIMASQEF